MIVSTGMSTIEEISETVRLIKKIGTPPVLTHCTSVILPIDYLIKVMKLNKLFNIPVAYQIIPVQFIHLLSCSSWGMYY